MFSLIFYGIQWQKERKDCSKKSKINAVFGEITLKTLLSFYIPYYYKIIIANLIAIIITLVNTCLSSKTTETGKQNSKRDSENISP